MSTFGSLLVQDHIVGVSEIEQALQRQVIYGGDLATNLLELDIVGENVVTEYMARSLGLPALVTDLVTGADPEAIKRIPWTVATSHEFVPVRIDEDRLVVAVSSPIKKEPLEELSFLLGFDFDQFFVLGFRLSMARNRYYGVPIPARFSALQAKLAPNFKPDLPPLVSPPSARKGLITRSDSQVESTAQRGPVTAGGKSKLQQEKIRSPGTEEEYVVESALADREADTTVRIFTPIKKSGRAENVKLLQVPEEYRKERAAEESDVPEQETGPSEKEPEAVEKIEQTSTIDLPPLFTKEASLRRKHAEERGLAFDLQIAIREMGEAKDRDSVIDLIMKHGVRAFDFVVFFVVHGNVAQGRSAAWHNNRSDNIEHLSIPLNQGGMFQTVFDTRSCHLGPLGTSEIEERVIKALGRPWPKNCAILPVTLRNRVVSVVYGDSGASGVQSDTITDFSRFTKAVAEAFERILLKKKALKDSKPPSSPPSERKEDTQEKSSKKDSWIPGAREPDSVGRYSVKPDEPKELSESKPRSNPPQPVREEEERAGVSEERETAQHRRIVDVRTSSPPPKMHREMVDVRSSILSSKPPKGYYSITPEPEDESDVPEGTAAAVLRHLEEEQPRETLASVKPPEKEKQEPPSSLVRTGSIINVTQAARGTESGVKLKGAALTEDSETRKTRPSMGAEAKGVTQSRVVSIGENRRPRSVIVEMKEEIDRLVERILTPGRFDETAADLLVGIGDDALAKIISKFPGPLLCDRYQQVGRLQPVGKHGPLLQTLLKFKKKAVPYLLSIFESPDSDVRFYATFMFSELIYPEAITSLTARLFDNDRQIRALAVDVIRGFVKYPEYRWAMKEVVEVLSAPNTSLEAKIIAAEALGQLRVSTCVESLIQMLDSVDTKLVERCHRALVRITFNDFGFRGPKWTEWYRENRIRHRVEWALDSIVHPKESLRNAAISEIAEIIGDVVDWSHGPMDHKGRLELQKKLRVWWAKEGRALFPTPGDE